MDDDDDRWYATWKFVADRGVVTRPDLLSEFGHLMWDSEALSNQQESEQAGAYNP
jgi:hypothetical protein